jgi:uncharacterized repeat protein (TIGR02543 family)
LRRGRIPSIRGTFWNISIGSVNQATHMTNTTQPTDFLVHALGSMGMGSSSYAASASRATPRGGFWSRIAVVGCLVLTGATALAQGVVDTPPAGYTRCAGEGGTCSYTGSANVVYGARSTWSSPRAFTGGTVCGNAVFGDPLYGVVKSCYYQASTASTPPPAPTTTDTPPTGYTRCANEGQACGFTGSANVVYGARSAWTAPRSFSGGTACTNTVFGDPLYGVVKGCYLLLATTTPKLNLNLTVTGAGGVGFSDGSSCTASCTKSFNTGANATLAASPAAGYAFAGWGGACSGTSTCTVTMDTAKNVTATFSASPATLSVSVSGSGAVNSTPSGINCGSSCSAPFAVGSRVTLTATPATGFTFTGWSGACTGAAACSVTLSASANVSAAFAAVTPPPPPPPPVAGLSCPTTHATVASSGGQQLALNVSRNAGVAPLAVFFDASGTTSTSTTRPFHELEYRWSFGDTASGVWTYGAKAGTASRNAAMGPVAAHVFETAGTYPVTLSAFDGGTTVSYNCNITVTSADAEFAGNKTVCVSGAGNFAGCPAGATQVTSANATTAFSNNIGAGNKRILFARGETFGVPAQIQINRAGPGMVGAYGTGAKPTLSNSAAIATFAMSSISTPAISDWRLVDLKIDGNGHGGNSVGAYGAGSIKNILFHRVDIQNMTSGLSFSPSNLDGINNSGFTSPMWDGLFVVDGTVYNLVGTGATGGNGYYLAGRRMAVMGNHVNTNFNGEHGMRSAFTDRGVYQHNTIEKVASGRAYLSVRAPDQGGSTLTAEQPGIVYTEKVVSSDNHLIGSAATSGFAGTGATNQAATGRAREQIWERNLLVGGSGTSGYLGFAGYQITARNNIMLMPAGGQAMAFSGQPLDATPNPTDIWIYNNSIYYAGTGNFYALTLVGGLMTGSRYTLQNNLWYTPNGGSYGTQINNAAGATLATCANCNTADSEIFVNPLTSTPPTKAADFKPLTGGYAIGRGVAVPVWSDYFGVPVAPGARDIGAVNR